MTTSTVYYVCGVILLGLPLFRLVRRPFRPQELDRMLASVRLRRQFWRSPWLVLDFVRALAGGWLLQQAALPGSGGLLDQSWLPPTSLVIAGVALCGTWLQQLPSATLAAVPLPLAYTTGLALGVLPPILGLPGVALALASFFAMRSTHGFSLAGAATAGALAILFHLGVGTAIKGVVIFGAPTALTLLLPRRQLWVLVPVREASPERARALQVPTTAPVSEFKL